MPGSLPPSKQMLILKSVHRTIRKVASSLSGTTVLALTWLLSANCLAPSNVCIQAMNIRGQVSAWPLFSASFAGMEEKSGLKAPLTKAQHFTLPCLLWKPPHPKPRQKKRIPLSSAQKKSFDQEHKMTIQATLFLSALFALVAASIYAYIGWCLSKRVISSSESRLAWQSFTVWWYGLAATTLIGGFLNLFSALGLTTLSLFVTATYINILVICIALWGLLYYLIYLFTGNNQWLLPLAVFYTIYYVSLVYYITASIPEDINITPWRTTLAYRAPLTGPFFGMLIVLLLLPQIIGGLAYFTLYFRVPEVTQKYRILL